MAGITNLNRRESNKNLQLEEKLQEHETDIERMMDVEPVCSALNRKGIIDDRDLSDILNLKTKKDKVNDMISRLCAPRRDGHRVLEELIDVLRKSETPDHAKLADKLEGTPGSEAAGPSLDPDEVIAARKGQSKREREVDKTIHDHEVRITNIERNDAKRRETKDADREEIERLRRALEEKERELAKLEERLATQEKENQHLKSHVAKLKSEIGVLQREKAELEDRVKGLETSLENMKTDLEDTKTNLKHTETDMSKVLERLERLEKSSTRPEPETRPRRTNQTIVPQNRFESQPNARPQPLRKSRLTNTGRGSARNNPRQ